MANEIEVNEDNFEEEVKETSKETPVVVDFWAEWCTPCKKLGPNLEELAAEFEGKFILAKLDIEHNRALAQKYGIMSIPAVKMFKEGEVKAQFVGAQPQSEIRQWLEDNL